MVGVTFIILTNRRNLGEYIEILYTSMVRQAHQHFDKLSDHRKLSASLCCQLQVRRTSPCPLQRGNLDLSSLSCLKGFHLSIRMTEAGEKIIIIN